MEMAKESKSDEKLKIESTSKESCAGYRLDTRPTNSELDYQNVNTSYPSKLVIIITLIMILTTSILVIYMFLIVRRRSISHFLNPHLTIFHELAVILLLTFELIFLFTFIWTCTYSNIFRKRFRLLFIWVLVIAIIFALLSENIIYPKSHQLLIDKFDQNFLQYDSNVTSKEFVDELQKKIECCGLENYLDWIDEDDKEKVFPQSCCLKEQQCNPWFVMKNGESECHKFVSKGCQKKIENIQFDRIILTGLVIKFGMSVVVFTVFLLIKKDRDIEFDVKRISTSTN